MAVCRYCSQEMTDLATISCVAQGVVIDGVKYAEIPYTPDDDRRRCHDCKIMAGAIHHFGCDMEVCPKCGGQLISCGCLSEEEEEDEESEDEESEDEESEDEEAL